MTDQEHHLDTADDLWQDAEKLSQAARVLEDRFRTGKHDDTVKALRSAVRELAARASHPMRAASLQAASKK